MKFELAFAEPSEQQCDLLLLPLFDSDVKEPPPTVLAIDETLDGALLQAAAEEDFGGRAEQSLLQHTQGKLPFARVLLLGLGSRERFNAEVLRLALGRGVKAARRVGARTVTVGLPETRDAAATVKAAVEGLLLGAYRFETYKTTDLKRRASRPELQRVRLNLPPETARGPELKESLELGQLVAESTNWARDRVNEPANALTPSTLARHAREVARDGGLKIEVLGREQIARLRMGMFLAVGQGSAEPPALIHLSYEPARGDQQPPLCLVGKAITFDSGGLSLKQTESMLEMKTDMSGAAAVLGAMRAIARLKPPFPVHAFMGACENMPDGRAYKVGDVLRSRLGKTVEVTNTDAEGRLVLGDILAWAAERKPALLVDVATLTGACIVALGRHIGGVFGTEDSAVWEVLEAAKVSGEELWRLPISELQRDNLKSEIADLKNSGERWGGAITAALFLKEFVGDVPWVHVDVAGPATSNKERGYLSKGATGIGVRTLIEIVRKRMRAAAPPAARPSAAAPLAPGRRTRRAPSRARP